MSIVVCATIFFFNAVKLLWLPQNVQKQNIMNLFIYYLFFTSPYLPSILEVERTSIVLNADDVR